MGAPPLLRDTGGGRTRRLDARCAPGCASRAALSNAPKRSAAESARALEEFSGLAGAAEPAASSKPAAAIASASSRSFSDPQALRRRGTRLRDGPRAKVKRRQRGIFLRRAFERRASTRVG